MKHALIVIAGVIGLAIGSVAGSALAQTTANGPYYATPSWDQTLPVATRFIVLSNMNSEAVLDRDTGLVWERTPSINGTSFGLADSDCIFRRTGGHYGWRAPSVYELATLVDLANGLPPGHPFIGILAANTNYWTNTPFSVGLGATSVWVVGFGASPGPGTVGPTSFPFRVWCVRAPGGHPPIAPTVQ